MTSYNPYKRVFDTLVYLCVSYTLLSITGFVGINVFNDNSFFAESLVTGNVTVCIKNSDKLFDEKTCRNRLHSNVDLFHGLKYFHYIFRSKEDPTKGLYIIARTSNTSVRYKLDYKITIPYYYREHTEGKTYGDVAFDPVSYCKKGFHPSCTTSDKLPPGFDGIDKFCCVCKVNVDGETDRARYNCDSHRDSVAMTYTCLEVLEPWYNLYTMSYPPDLLRNTVFSIYKFDNSKGVIPDLELHKDGYYDNFDNVNEKKLDPSFKEAEKKVQLEEDKDTKKMVPESEKDSGSPKKEVENTKSTESFGVRTENNTLLPNYRNILIDSTTKEATIEDMDITISLLSSNSKNGTIPPMLDKYVAVPSFPRTSETVKGSSLMDKCTDSTWPKTLKCPEYMSERVCNTWRCTLNMRTVDKDAVDLGGNQCDKIGYSLQAHTNHRKLCSMRVSSCINHQLKWYLDQKKDEAKLPNFYGVGPAITIQNLKVPRTEDPEKKRTTWFQEDRVHHITYVHSEDDVSRFKIDTFDAEITEIISDFPGFILSTKIDKECKLKSTDICTLQVKVKNMGSDTSNYTINSMCYADDTSKAKDNIIAEVDETTLSIEGNSDKLFNVPIKLSGAPSSGKSHCIVNLLSGTRKHLDTSRTDIKISGVKPTIGMDPKFLNPDVFTVAKNVTPKQGYKDKDKSGDDKTEGKKILSDSKNPECTCSSWNIFCMIINFKTCVVSKLSKVFTYIMIGLGILLFIILLPVIIPLLGAIINSIIKVCKMPQEAMERKRLENMKKTVTNVTPLDFKNKNDDYGMNNTRASENITSYPGVSVNLNLSDIKKPSGPNNNSYENNVISVNSQSVKSGSVESLRSRQNEVNQSLHEEL